LALQHEREVKSGHLYVEKDFCTRLLVPKLEQFPEDPELDGGVFGVLIINPWQRTGLEYVQCVNTFARFTEEANPVVQGPKLQRIIHVLVQLVPQVSHAPKIWDLNQ
jgi:hypothetical protein